MSLPETRDVVVVGAGTAGAAAALALARRKLDVLLVDARPLDRTGARWVNALPMWMFDEAGVPRPEAPELRGEDEPFIIVSPGDRSRYRLPVERLIRLGREQGVEAAGELQARGLSLDSDGRPRVLELEGPEGLRRVQARLFVDATGMKGALRKRVPALERDCPPLTRHDICSAAQEVCEVIDADGARRFLQRWRMDVGETRCLTGKYGGYSIENVLVDHDLATVDVLTGSIADGQHADGPGIIARLRDAEGWIGPRVFGGAGILPVRRPYDRLAVPGLALVGDAACQNFSAHGSGIGMGMVAGEVLASAVAGASDPGSLEATWGYQSSFQRTWGGLLAGYELMRRLTQSLEPDELERLLGSRIIPLALFQAGMEQRVPPIAFGDPREVLRGAIAQRDVVARTVRFLGRFPALLAHYRRYPVTPDQARLRRWSWLAGNLAGDRPDLRPASP